MVDAKELLKLHARIRHEALYEAIEAVESCVDDFLPDAPGYDHIKGVIRLAVAKIEALRIPEQDAG